MKVNGVQTQDPTITGYIEDKRPLIARCVQVHKEIMFNPLLHRLFLDHDIIFYFLTTLKKFKKDLS